MKNLKKLLALLLALAMTLTSLTVTAFAEVEEEPAYVASVVLNGEAEQNFETLEEAFAYANVANGKAVITLLDDVEVSSYIKLAEMESDAPNFITLDMNGKKLTYTEDTEDYGFIWVQKYTTLTITGNGEIVSNAKYYFRSKQYATIIVESGTFTGATEFAWYNYASSYSIRGGSFNLDLTQTHIHDKQTLTNLIKDPYIQTHDDGTGLYTVSVSPDAKVLAIYNGKNYYSFQEALDAAIYDEGDEALITLTGEDLGKSYTIENPGKKLIFDLNGTTLQPADTHRLFWFRDGEFEIRNGYITANGSITTNGYLLLRNSELTLDNIVFNGDPTGGNTQTEVDSYSGGAIYAQGSYITLKDSCIKNCYDTASAGAIYLAKYTDTNVESVLKMENSTIENCGSAYYGGAVYVDYSCKLIMDEESVIDGCSSQKGGAVYIAIADGSEIPAKGSHTAGEAIILGDITNCVSTDALSDAPIYSNGFVYSEDPNEVENAEIVDDGDVYQMQTNAAFETIGGNVGDVITLSLTAKIAYEKGVEKDPKLMYSYEGKNYEIRSEKGGNYLDFTVEKINLYDVATDFVFYIKDEYIVSNGVRLSVQDYFDIIELYYNEDNREDVLTFCAQTLVVANDLVRYSGTQKTGKKGTEVVFSGWETGYFLNGLPSDIDNVKSEIYDGGKTDENKIAGISLNITDQMALSYKIYATNGYNITAKNSSGEPVEIIDGRRNVVSTPQNPWYAYQEKLSPLAFDETFTICMTDKDDTLIHAITYSVNSYCYSMYNSSNISSELQTLALSIFRFGIAAERLGGQEIK